MDGFIGNPAKNWRRFSETINYYAPGPKEKELDLKEPPS